MRYSSCCDAIVLHVTMNSIATCVNTLMLLQCHVLDGRQCKPATEASGSEVNLPASLNIFSVITVNCFIVKNERFSLQTN